MNAGEVFQPDWASHPGASIGNLIEERGWTISEFANAMHRSIHEVSRLLCGYEQIDKNWAEQLAHSLGASATFWLRREEQYRKDVARLAEVSNPEISAAWLSELPFEDMARFGWLAKGLSTEECASNALAFFGVPSVESWHRRYCATLELAAYRSSAAFETKPAAVAAWLRQGELSAVAVDCQPWDRERLLNVLPKLRLLSREPDPDIFLPQLVGLCSECGVAVITERAPSGCRASGATRFLSQKKALILLSFRYLSDDQLWFTVFHEIGHLLLHSQDRIFLEGIEPANPTAEAEADEFARLHLLTEQGLNDLGSLPLNHFAIARLAKRIGVSSGIVVGQLQHMGRVPHRHFNYLKARYAWRNG